MPKVIEGHLQAGELRFAIVASRFNSFVVEPLVAGALDAITLTGGNPDEVTLVRCPGAWELPQVVAAVARAGYRGLMSNKRLVLPGVGVRMIPFMLRFAPRSPPISSSAPATR